MSFYLLKTPFRKINEKIQKFSVLFFVRSNFLKAKNKNFPHF